MVIPFPAQRRTPPGVRPDSSLSELLRWLHDVGEGEDLQHAVDRIGDAERDASSPPDLRWL